MNAKMVYRCNHCWSTALPDVGFDVPPSKGIDEDIVPMWRCSNCGSLSEEQQDAEACCPNGEAAF